MYKKQVSELHQKLAEETKRTDKVDFENRKLQEKLQALTREREVRFVQIFILLSLVLHSNALSTVQSNKHKFK
jgi:hypothetical protein